MPNWEYRVWQIGGVGADDIVYEVNGKAPARDLVFYDALAAAGRDGWELVGIDGTGLTLFFKRPKE